MTKNKNLLIVYGIVVSNLFALVSMFGTKWAIEKHGDGVSLLVFSQFVLIPIVMGSMGLLFPLLLEY